LGMIVAADKLVGVFGPNDERVVAMLASSAVIGLENVRVHLQAQRLARMEERQRIAQSLHETMAQMLFSNGLAIERAIEGPLENDSVRQSLEIARHLSARSSEELRSAIFALSKPELRGGHSLIDLIREQVQEFQSASGVTAKFIVPGPVAEQLPHPVGEAIYRILRESLTNVQKHAQAANVVIRLLYTQESVFIMIQDDGKGLGEIKSGRSAGQSFHFGIKTMRQLVEQVNGEFSITNNEEGGVTVQARLPIQGVNDN
ncbi:MAG: sensor histidine kinase, partial [Anaerolineales bacterium]|nr:sensor histidine kinase [Anaerolineales bacterium]